MKASSLRTLLLLLTVAATLGVLNATGGDGRPILLGGNHQSDATLADALKNIKQAAEFASADARSLLDALLKDTRLVAHYSQVVAGSNETYVFQTRRGFECFKIYNRFDGKEISLLNYARGEIQSDVTSKCGSFRDIPSKAELVKRVFSQQD